jgi:hypothetical protein
MDESRKLDHDRWLALLVAFLAASLIGGVIVAVIGHLVWR